MRLLGIIQSLALWYCCTTHMHLGIPCLSAPTPSDPMHTGHTAVLCLLPDFLCVVLQTSLNSIGYQVINSTQCQEQSTGQLPADFFSYQWQTYNRYVLEATVFVCRSCMPCLGAAVKDYGCTLLPVLLLQFCRTLLGPPHTLLALLEPYKVCQACQAFQRSCLGALFRPKHSGSV